MTTRQRLSDRGLLNDMCRIAAEHNVLAGDVFGKSRRKRVTAARHACWAHLYGLGFSYPEIGTLWGAHNTTVLSAVRKAKGQ